MKSQYSISMPILTPNLLKYFWDCDKSKLDFNVYQSYILNRLMQYGNLEAIKWILNNYEREYVVNYLAKKGKNTLDRKSYLFWEKISKSAELWP